MALDFQIINMPFAGGLDTKTDPFQIPLGKLLVCQNAVFNSPGKLQKRNGYSALTKTILGGGTISTGTALFTRQSELCLVGGTASGQQTLCSYDSANTAWVSKGNMPSVTATVGPGATSQYSCISPDMAQTSGGLQCFVYELFDQNSTGTQKQGIGYSIVDSTTGQVVVAPATLDATATSVSPHVIVLGTNFCVYYIQGDLAATADIFVKTISTTTPNAAPSAAVKVTSGTTTSTLKISANAYQFDCVADSTGANGYISFNNRSNGTTVFDVLSATPSTVTHSVIIAATNSRISTVFMDVNGNVVLAYSDGGTASAAVFSSDLSTTVKAATSIETTLAHTSITGVSTAANTLTFFVGTASAFKTQQTRTNTMTTASYTVGTAATLIRQLVPAGKAFTVNSTAYVPLMFCVNSVSTVNSMQTTLFIVDSSANLIGKALTSTLGGYPAIGSTTGQTVGAFYQLGASLVSSSTVTMSASVATRIPELSIQHLTLNFGPPLGLITGPTVTFTAYQFAVQSVSFNFSDTTNGYLHAELANTVHTSGSIMQMYDGTNVCEHGFLLYPWTFTLAAVGSGGSMSAGSYSYVIVYEWMDGQGQVHRSAPSSPIAVTAVLNDSVNITNIPTLQATAKSNVLVQVYRTQANGTTYYQLTNYVARGSLYNSKSADTVSFTDTFADTAISTAPQLYTTGNVLQDQPPPPAGALTVHRNRLCVVDSTNPTQVWVSKQVVQPAPVEFSGFLVLNVDPKGGAVTALASLDDKLIEFKGTRIFETLGQGPDATGNQNDFTDAISVSTDTGSVSPKSVLLMPDGIMFDSPKGIHLLSRSLQLEYIGAPVAGGGATPTQTLGVFAVLLPALSKQAWIAVNGTLYLYDTLCRQWATATGGSTAGNGWTDMAIIGLTAIYQLDSVGNVLQISGSLFTDAPAGTYTSMTVTTGWIKLSGLHGYQRARSVSVLGTYKSAHTLTIAIDYDYQTSNTQTATFVIAADAAPYQYSVHLARQKCEAIRVTISDSAQSGTGESFSLSGIAVEVGLKKGTRRLPAAQTA